MRLFLKILLILLLVLLVIYLLGPTAEFEQVDVSPAKVEWSIDNVEQSITDRERSINGIKPKNEANFIWANPSKEKTEYAIVYLHGFTASHKEGFPIIQNFATRYKANLYLPRLYKHGLSDVDAMADVTPAKLLASAKEAIAVAKLLGDKIILMSTSTGSTYGSYLANNDPSIVAQIMMAPNFALHDPNAQKITGRWGKEMIKQTVGGMYRSFTGKHPKVKDYWQTKARIEGYIAVQGLIEQTMTEETWTKNNVPTFIGYYYKDEANKDKVISIEAIKRYAELASIPENQLRVIPFADAEGHVIGSQFMNDNWESVQDAIFSFAEEVLNLKKSHSLVVTYPE